MCTIVVDKWCRFIYANLIFICCSNLSCVRRAIHTADSDIAMAGTRYNLHSFKSTCQNNNVATSGVSLKQPIQHHHKYIILITVKEISSLQFLITIYAVILTLQGRNVSVLHKHSARTAQWTLSTSVIKTNLLMMYKAKVTVSSEIHTKHINAM